MAGGVEMDYRDIVVPINKDRRERQEIKNMESFL
jgi:DNA-binding cell septation regulator SpoVG